MMENIRLAANSFVVKVIFAIIILCFIFTGVGFLGFGGSNSARDEQMYIAKVDGEGLSRTVFENQVKRESENAGAYLSDPDFVQQLRREVLTYQINNHLIGKLANDINAKVGNAQIKDAIRKESAFFEEGKFSNKKYLSILAQYGYTPDSYAEVLRLGLQKQQVINALSSSLFVLPIDSELSLLEDQTRIAYAAPINAALLKIEPVKIEKQDIQKYYDEHPSEFIKKERVKFKYIGNFKQDFANKVNVNDNELRKEYKNNIQQYQVPGKKAYSIIYVANKDKANEIAAKLTSTNFEQMAKTENSSEHVSQYGKNGALGWFTDDESLPQPFKQANLNNIGEISKPISVEDGYLLIKLDNIQPVMTKDFESVKSVIEKEITAQKISKILEERENALQAELAKNAASLDEIAKKTKTTLNQVDWTSYGDEKSVLRYPEIRDVAFGSTMIVDGKAIGKMSEIIPIGDQQDESIIIQVTDYRPEGVAPLDEVEHIIHKKLYAKWTNEKLQSAAAAIVNELTEKGTSNKITFAKRYSLTRNSQELDPKVVDAIFDLVPAENKPVFGVQFVDDENGYIVMLKDVLPAKNTRDLSAKLLASMKKNIQYYLSLDLKAKAKIELMPNANL